jgi:hypothetical protein
MLTLVVALVPSSLFASIYGVLAGKVVDADGKGVRGATVLVEGTSRGTSVRSNDGSFTVANITAGNYTVRVRAIGKQEYRINVRISADETTNINVTLKDDAVMMEEVVVTAQAQQQKVNSEEVGSINTLSAEQLTNTTASNIAGVVAMSAGVSSGDGSGYAIRGSRPSETQIRLDGLNMGDQFSGGFGSSGSSYFPMVSSYATEEVQVITGNFAAQYGDAQGGIVNSVMKTGRTDRFEGHLAFTTDVPFLAGSQANNSQIVYSDGKYKVVDGDGDGADLIMAGTMNFDVGFGGPLSFINDRSTFYLNVVNQYSPHGSYYDIKDADGNSYNASPLASVWVKNFEGRIAWGITNDIRLVIGGKYGLTNYYGSNSFQYDYDIATPYVNPQTGEIDPVNGVPVSNGITAEEGKIVGANQYVQNVFARINHTLTDRSYYELTLAWGANNQESGRRVAGSDLNYFTGFELMEPTDNWIVDAATWSPSAIVAGRNVGDKIVDWAAPVSSVTESQDGYCLSTWNGRNPFTGYYEGQPYSSSTRNPYGMQGLSYSGGAAGFNYQYGNFLQASGDYNLFGVKTGEFTHDIKAGFEGAYYIMDRHYNSTPYSGSPTYDIYTDRWGGNIYAETEEEYNLTSEAKNQFKLGAYVQDQIKWRGIVFNPGLRLDIMDPMSKYRVIDADYPQFIPITSEKTGVGGFEEASVKYRISPRLNINYPITERSYVSMSYGQFFQSPAADYLYYFFNLNQLNSNLYVGDPNMEAQQTNQYQVSYQNQLTDEFAFTASVYYKDIYNQLGLASIMTTPQSYLQYAVSEYGTSKGFEFTLSKSLSNYFGFDLSYTLAYLTVTSSEVTSNQDVLRDPYTDKLTYPLAPFFSSNDVRHTFKGSIYFALGNGEGPELFGMHPLQNLNLAFEPTFRSGFPYTKTEIGGGLKMSDNNVYRYPSYFNINARLSKAFALKDWFGESMGNSRLMVFVNIQNVLNRRAATQYYTGTSDPLDAGTGLNYTLLGNFSATPWYKEATMANSASYTTEQYDTYGYRLYSEAADTDANGIVTQQEKYDAWKKFYKDVTIQQRSLFQAPIRVTAGVVIQF